MAAGKRCGAFGVLPAIDKCRTSPVVGEEWGLHKASFKRVGDVCREMPCSQVSYGSMVLSLFRHPDLLVPANIKTWEREYIYAGPAYGMTPILDRHACAVEAKEIYDSAMSIFGK